MSGAKTWSRNLLLFVRSKGAINSGKDLDSDVISSI